MEKKFSNTILVPTDFSEPCANAASHAMHIAKILNYKVVLFHAINRDTASVFPGEKDLVSAVGNKMKELALGLKKQVPVSYFRQLQAEYF